MRGLDAVELARVVHHVAAHQTHQVRQSHDVDWGVGLLRQATLRGGPPSFWSSGGYPACRGCYRSPPPSLDSESFGSRARFGPLRTLTKGTTSASGGTHPNQHSRRAQACRLTLVPGDPQFSLDGQRSTPTLGGLGRFGCARRFASPFTWEAVGEANWEWVTESNQSRVVPRNSGRGPDSQPKQEVSAALTRCQSPT
jgi:hypothetical protein